MNPPLTNSLTQTSHLRSTIPVEIRDDSRNSCLDFISSDESLDRYNEIISASGWKLDNYLRNPVFQNAHQYGDILFTLGRALLTEVRAVAGRKALFQRIQFACDINPMAKIAYGLYKGKFLNAVSVGFVPLRWEDGSSESSSSSSSSSSSVSSLSASGGPRSAERSRDLGHQTGGGVGNSLGRGEVARSSGDAGNSLGRGEVVRASSVVRRRYLEQELLEVSAVGIPANPNALALGLKSGAIQKSDLRETFDLLRLTLEKPNTHHESVFSLAKDLRSLLKS